MPRRPSLPRPARAARDRRRPPGTASAVLRFALGSLVAIAVVVVGAFLVLRSITVDEAERDTKERVVVEARLVQAAGLTDGLVRGDPRALAKLDDVVQGQVLTGSVVRVKLWTRGGRILYSDEPRLVGARFGLGAEERELFENGEADAELSDLTQPENRYERQEGRLLEAHTVVRTPDGTPVLFEIYQRFSSVTASGERLLGKLAPPLVGGVLVLLLLQAPLAWGMARRLQRQHRDREVLLAAAVASSDRERRRIAGDLHDGVVQDLAGAAFGLAPVAAEAERRGDHDEAAAVRTTVERLRQAVRDLRTMLVDIHPPRVADLGLTAVVDDLLSPLRAAGVATELHVDDALAAGTANDELLHRAAREALRNAEEHAAPTRVAVAVARVGEGRVRLTVADDGRGCTPAEREDRGAEGHVGLRLLEDLVADAGGTFRIESGPGAGTTVTVELPA